MHREAVVRLYNVTVCFGVRACSERFATLMGIGGTCRCYHIQMFSCMYYINGRFSFFTIVLWNAYPRGLVAVLCLAELSVPSIHGR